MPRPRYRSYVFVELTANRDLLRALKVAYFEPSKVFYFRVFSTLKIRALGQKLSLRTKLL